MDPAPWRSHRHKLAGREPGPPTTQAGADASSSSSWRDLPDDVFGQILSLLPSRYRRLRLAEVCRSWHDAVRRHYPRRKPAAAYLALPSGQVHAFPADLGWSHHFTDCTGFRGAACDDWLLFHDTDGILLLKSPFTGKTRLLPGLLDVRVRDDPVEIVNEPDPRAGAPMSQQWTSATEEMAVQKMLVFPDGLVVAAVVGREHFAKVALCSAETFSWSIAAHDRWRWYEDVAFCDGKLYALTGDEDLLVFDVGVATCDVGDAVVSRVERVIKGRWPIPGTVKARHLVPRGSDLFMVCRHFSCAADAEAPALWFTVFAADLASSSSQWTEVSSLGGEALFVGRMCSRAVREDNAVRGDQIFFLHDDYMMPFWAQHRGMRPDHHAGVYDMRDGTVTNILRRPQLFSGPTPPTWLFPQRSQVI